MAHDPLKKSQVIVDLANGMSIGKAASTHGVSKATVGEWAKELRASTGQTAIEVKQSKFVESVDRFGTAVMDMLTAQAELLADPNYTKNQPNADVVAHTRFIRDSLIGLIRLQRAVSRGEPIPESSELVRAEIVDA